MPYPGRFAKFAGLASISALEYPPRYAEPRLADAHVLSLVSPPCGGGGRRRARGAANRHCPAGVETPSPTTADPAAAPSSRSRGFFVFGIPEGDFRMAATQERPIALFHEHPDWFRPLFTELERRGTPFVRIPAAEHGYDPEAAPPYSLVFNRMSPSAYLRGAGNAIFYTQSWLDHLERNDVRVVNGRGAYAVETSKA